jgi:hypothetical protein
MKSRSSRLAAALAIALSLSAAPARAQTPEPVGPAQSTPSSLGDSLQGSAKEAYESASLLLRNNDFAGAITKFQQAYDLSKDPRLLYDMAVCHKSLHAYARMKTLLERYEREAGVRMPVDARARVDAALAAIAKLVGAVKLSVLPDGATVLLDGAPLGTTPLAEPAVVDLGMHTLSIHKEGYEPVEQPVDVAGGSVADLKVTLAPAGARLAELVVKTDEAATVGIDGRIGATGRYQEKLPPGSHTIRVIEPGKISYQADVELRPGETRTMDVTLQDEKHTVSWPLIAGGVALVAAAVVGGYFLLDSSSTTTTTTPVPAGKVGGVQLSSVRR